MKLLFLSDECIKKIELSIEEIVKLIEDVFKAKGEKKVEMPPKIGIHPLGLAKSFIHAMPCSLPTMEVAGCKWISGYVDNYKYNLPYLNGVIIINDLRTGLPVSIMDCKWVTTMRTAAVSTIAAKYLAKSNSSRLAIVGCGVQGKAHLKFLANQIRSIEVIAVYDVNAEKMNEIKMVSRELGLSTIMASSPKDAILGSDIIVTATTAKLSPTVRSEWLKEGVLGLPLEGPHYWMKETFYQVEKFITDDRAQTHYHFSDLPIYADLGEIVTREKSGRENDQEKIICMNYGVAIADIALGSIIVKEARKRNIGLEVTL